MTRPRDRPSIGWEQQGLLAGVLAVGIGSGPLLSHVLVVGLSPVPLHPPGSRLEVVQVHRHDLRLARQDRLEDIRQRFPGMRLIGMLHQRSQVRQIIHLEQMEIVIKPLSLDEMGRKIREAILSKQRHKVEEDFLRLKKEVFRF